MILVYHNNTTISEIISSHKEIVSFDKTKNIAVSLLEFAQRFPNLPIAWCHVDFKSDFNCNLESVFYHRKLMLSFNPGEENFFGDKIGYAEHLPFIKINKEVTYPSWQMSSCAGIIHASVLQEIKGKIKPDADFDYFLNSIAKLCMPLGLLCYSEPKLLRNKNYQINFKSSNYKLFRFVKQHYKTSWTFLLFINLLIYERQLAFLPFLSTLFFRSRNAKKINIDTIKIERRHDDFSTSFDVILPTIGRKNFLYDVLCDLRNQTKLPENVIVVEQNSLVGSISELDYLTNQTWPFTIKHTFTNTPGACNARNIALDAVESDWVFFADDDIRIEPDFVENTFHELHKTGASAVSINCLHVGEKQKYEQIFQWSSFGSGCSFVSRKAIKNSRFNMSFEFGYGEDSEFGMQLRNQGCDILYLPFPSILHLRAPVGGFRFKPVLEWKQENIQPKPSPTVMLYHLLHYSKEELRGYKTTLFLKFYKEQKIKNPFIYYKMFRKQWDKSVFWARKLNDRTLQNSKTE